MLPLHDTVSGVLHNREEPEEGDHGERGIEEAHRITRTSFPEVHEGASVVVGTIESHQGAWSCEPRGGMAIENSVDSCARDGLRSSHAGAEI